MPGWSWTHVAEDDLAFPILHLPLSLTLGFQVCTITPRFMQCCRLGTQGFMNSSNWATSPALLEMLCARHWEVTGCLVIEFAWAFPSLLWNSHPVGGEGVGKEKTGKLINSPVVWSDREEGSGKSFMRSGCWGEAWSSRKQRWEGPTHAQAGDSEASSSVDCWCKPSKRLFF